VNQTPDTHDSLIVRLSDPADHEAWPQFAVIYRPLIYRLARSRGLQDADAQDLVQRVLLSVADAIDRWVSTPRTGRFRTWLHAVARNAAIDHFRTLKPDRAAGGTTAMQKLHDAETPLSDDQLQIEFQREVFCWAAAEIQSEFTEAVWAAFWRTAVDEISIEEVAGQLGKSTGAIYIARSRVMRRLRERVREYDVEMKPEAASVSQRDNSTTAPHDGE
jgi:RNA polymerase sigma-70 factor (ECF subfamily)